MPGPQPAVHAARRALQERGDKQVTMRRAPQESARTFKDLIVVHNLRTITDEQALWHQWRQQVTDMYGEGEG